MPRRRTLHEEVLLLGTYDWLAPGDFISVAWHVAPDDDAVLWPLCLGLIAEVVLTELMRPGDLVDGGFRPWGLPPSEAFARIAERWLTTPRHEVHTGDIFWLESTPEAFSRGMAIRDEPDGASVPHGDELD